MSEPTNVVEARNSWMCEIAQMDDGPARTAELRQMIVDAMDAVEQSGADEDRMIAALRGFDSVGDRNRR